MQQRDPSQARSAPPTLERTASYDLELGGVEVSPAGTHKESPLLPREHKDSSAQDSAGEHKDDGSFAIASHRFTASIGNLTTPMSPQKPKTASLMNVSLETKGEQNEDAPEDK